MNNQNTQMTTEEWVEYGIQRIKNKSFTFKDLFRRDVKAIVYEKLLKEVEDGLANDIVISAIVDYQVEQVKMGRVNIDDVSILIKDKVFEKIN